MNSKRLVIIDGNSLIFRAYYAIQRPMITKSGQYTHGIYGFLNMLSKIQKEYEPGYIAVTFDLAAPTFRHKEYAEYKATRKKMPPELAMQMEPMKEVLRAMNIRILEKEGFEGDDIIGTLARRGEKEGLEPLIITGDRDALQLATDEGSHHEEGHIRVRAFRCRSHAGSLRHDSGAVYRLQGAAW